MTQTRPEAAEPTSAFAELLREDIPTYFEGTDYNATAGRATTTMLVYGAARDQDMVALSIAQGLFTEQMDRADLNAAQRAELQIQHDFVVYAKAKDNPTSSAAHIYELMQDGGDERALAGLIAVYKDEIHRYVREKRETEAGYGIAYGLFLLAENAHTGAHRFSFLQQPDMAPFWQKILTQAEEVGATDYEHMYETLTVDVLTQDTELEGEAMESVLYSLYRHNYLQMSCFARNADNTITLEWGYSLAGFGKDLLTLVRTNALARRRAGLVQEAKQS